VEREAREALAARLVGEVPKAMIDSRTDELTQDFFDTLKERGYSFDDYAEATGIDEARMRVDIGREAEARVRDELALEALARAVGMEVADDEVALEIERLAETQKTSAAKLRERLTASGALPLIREDLTQRQAVRWLMENVEVLDGDPQAPDTARKPVAKKPVVKKAAKRKKAVAKKDVSDDAE
jgi:trigger factor